MLDRRGGAPAALTRTLLLAGLAAAATLPAVAREGRAQEREANQEAARVDSLATRVARLEVLVDSLVAELARRPITPPAPAAAPEAERPGQEGAGAEPEPGAEAPGEEADELAALRAAARVAAAERAQAGPDTGQAGESRTRNLQSLNPEISVTGDFLGQFIDQPGGEQRLTGVPREFEFSFQAALDPYTRTKIFVTRHEDFEIAGLEGVLGHGREPGGEEPGAHQEEGEEEAHGFEIEEGYMYWVGLPGNLGLKAGKFRQEIGLYNRWHNHALFEVDRPLAPAAFLGPEGLAQTGASVTLPSVQAGPATGTAWLEVTGASNPLFEGGTDLSYLGRAQGFFDLGPSTYVQLGVNGLYGENDDLGLTSRLLGVDVSYDWSPSGRSLYEQLSLKGEWYWAERDLPSESESGTGGYAQANYRLDRRWVVGLRADYLDGLEAGPSVVQLVPSISWWQSEWVRLRLQYNYVDAEDADPGHTLLFQTVWAVGPHKHETY